MKEYRQFYINGAWVDPLGKETLDVINPATEEPIAKIAFLTRLTEAAVREVLGLAAAAGAEVRACAPTTRLASSVTPPSPGDAKARSRAPNHACPPSSRTRRASECCE